MIVLDKFFKSNIFKAVVIIYLVLISTLGRTFVGLNIFGFRLGELTMAASFIVLLFFVLFGNANHKNNIFKFIYYPVVMLFLSFIFLAIYNNDNFLYLYIYKTSSYIWTIGALFLGYYFFQNYEVNKKLIYVFYAVLAWVYYFSIYGVDDSIQRLLLNFSDKFEYHKGSDLLIIFIFITFISNRTNTKYFNLFLIFSSLYFPLMVFKSRAGSFAFFIYLVLEVIHNKKYFTKLNMKNYFIFIFSIFVLIQSVFFVTKSGIVEIEKIEENVEFLAEYRVAKPNKNSTVEETRFLYFYNSRLYSADGNLNWRLQIWQDVYEDLTSNKLIFFGYGFDEIIPAMDNPLRSGNDGTNENVHNFLINILARGGILQLSVYFYFYFSLFQIFLKNKNIYEFMILIIPVLTSSLFDASMENAHYPILFYLLVGYLISRKDVSV